MPGRKPLRTVLGGSGGPAVKDTTGNPLANNYTSSFFTNGPGPLINSTNPAPGAPGVSSVTAASVTFSNPMDPTSLSSSTIFLKDPSGNVLLPRRGTGSQARSARDGTSRRGRSGLVTQFPAGVITLPGE